MISHIADYLGRLLDSSRLRIVGYWCKIFALGLFEIFVIFRLALNSSIFGETANFRRVGNSCRLGLRTVSITVRPLLKTLVVFQAQGHVALVTLEAALVPELVQTPEALHRVDSFITSGALAGAHLD